MTSGYGGFPARSADLYPIVRGVVDTTGVPPEHMLVFAEYEENLAQAFVGLTTDGKPRLDLFPLEETGASTSLLAARASEYLGQLSEEQRSIAQLPLDSDRWRAWINAFAPRPPHGVLLDDLSSTQQAAAMAIFEAAFSPRGFEQIRTAMKINEALADIADGYRDTLKEYVYWFTIFGEPSDSEPWGFQMYGHHSCVNVFVLGSQVTVGPMFIGTEPRVVETKSGELLRAFDEELRLGLEFMRSLRVDQREKATLVTSLEWADLPPELAHPTEGRMRGSAARDNAVVPLEGISGAELDRQQKEHLVDLLRHYSGRLAEPHATLLLGRLEEVLDETYVAWGGPIAEDEPFYYKIHSPLLFVELDAHSGIFIANDDPKPFHIHNIVRTPNGNDYGHAWLQKHQQGA